MKILLIDPGSINNKSLFNKFYRSQYFPRSLSLLILAALTPQKHSVELYQGPYEDINFEDDYDIVGITSITPYAPYAYDLADRFRHHGKTVVLGGWHPSALPEEAKQHADAVVIGEAEETWPEFLKDFGENKLKPFYRQTRIVDPKLIPCLNMYNEYIFQVQATRGCSTGCEFCCMTNAKFRNIFRCRPIENVIKEIESMPNKNFIFSDSSLTMNPKYTKSLFFRMKNLNKRFIGMGNTNVLSKDEELLNLAKEAGCIGWYIGFESISQESIDHMGKKTNKVEDYRFVVKKIHKHDMMIIGSFVFGFDTDKPETFDLTFNFVDDIGIDVPDPLILTPFPGTPLYNRFKSENRIITEDWLKYDLEHVVFKPKNMSPQDLTDSVHQLYKDFFSRRKISKRIFKSIQLGYYPFINVINQNYVSAKRRYT